MIKTFPSMLHYIRIGKLSKTTYPAPTSKIQRSVSIGHGHEPRRTKVTLRRAIRISLPVEMNQVRLKKKYGSFSSCTENGKSLSRSGTYRIIFQWKCISYYRRLLLRHVFIRHVAQVMNASLR